MIAAIGIATVDHIMVLDGFKTGEGSFHADTYRVEGGGMAATALCAAAKLGSPARLFTRIGDDINGRFIVERLNAFSVDTSCMVTIPDAPSFTSFILVDANTGDKQFYNGVDQPVLDVRAGIDTDALGDAKVLLVDGFWMEAAIAGARWASERGIPVVGDFKTRYDGLEELLPYVSYLIVPEFFAHELTGSDLLADMLRGLGTLCPGQPVITCGTAAARPFWGRMSGNTGCFRSKRSIPRARGTLFMGRSAIFSRTVTIPRDVLTMPRRSEP